MLRFTEAFLLFVALSAAFPASWQGLSTGLQQVLHSEHVKQPAGNPRKLKGKFLHISDLHPDPFYKIGAEADGDHPCHQGKGSNATALYGAPTTDCDSPFALVNATFKWIEENVRDEIDFVVWTGDSARHDNDDDIPRSSQQIIQLNEYVVSKFVEVFGKTDNIDDPDPTNDFIVPIVPTYGNNDILPHNVFMPGPNSWTKSYVEIWKGFIPQEQKHTFARGGWFWTEVIPNKLAIISLNTLYFFENNSGVDGCDLHSEPGYEHMEWLRIQLQFMRERGMKAFLIGHVPPARTESKQAWDETCYQKYILWQRQYRDVIAANFFGHMNIDHFMFHDIKDLAYRFKIDGIDDAYLRSPNKAFVSTMNKGEYTTMGKTAYLNELRDGWGDLPAPPRGVKYGSREFELERNKKQQKDRKEFFREIGGPYGERFSMSMVGPSVVPNYFPTLRIVEYNMTGLEKDHPAMGLPKGHPATEEDLHYLENDQPSQGSDIDTADKDDLDADKKKKHKKKKKGKHDKDTRPKPDFPVPAPPAKTAPPGPAYSPQTFSLLAWTQLYANLTDIHEQMARSVEIPDQEVGEAGRKKRNPFGYHIEYETNNDRLHNMTDLTITQWLGLAERIGRTKFQRPDHVSQLDATGAVSNSMILGDEDQDVVEDRDDLVYQMKKKKKKHHKDRKKSGKLKNNELWHQFIRRVFVHSKSDAELADDFD